MSMSFGQYIVLSLVIAAPVAWGAYNSYKDADASPRGRISYALHMAGTLLVVLGACFGYVWLILQRRELTATEVLVVQGFAALVLLGGWGRVTAERWIDAGQSPWRALWLAAPPFPLPMLATFVLLLFLPSRRPVEGVGIGEGLSFKGDV